MIFSSKAYKRARLRPGRILHGLHTRCIRKLKLRRYHGARQSPQNLEIQYKHDRR